VIGHQYVGVDRTPTVSCGVGQIIPVVQIVLFGKKARLEVIAPLDDVLRNLWQIQAGKSSHAGASAKVNTTLASRAVDGCQ
jgi:hypothetical protein